MHSYIRPNTHVALRLPSGVLKILEIQPNTTIDIGKFGKFPANLLLGRPYYFTFELLDKDDEKSQVELRVVSAAELHAEALGSDHATPTESRDEPTDGGAEFDIVGEDGEVIMRSNRLTIDDPSRQTLSMDEIEELKKAGSGSGKEIIAKIMASHQAIDEKTSFSLAKYTLRKSRKYLKRFTVLPVDVGTLAEFLTEREAFKVQHLREETLGLINSWANVHCGEASRYTTGEDGITQIGGGRWLVVDDTGGLVVAALAEKMGILYPEEEDDDTSSVEEAEDGLEAAQETGEQKGIIAQLSNDAPVEDITEAAENIQKNGTDAQTVFLAEPQPQSTDPSPSLDLPPRSRKAARPHIPQMSSSQNTITLIQPNNQPNLAHLRYFGFDSGKPSDRHPLYTHLKTLSWLQLLYPHQDPSYIEPEVISEEVLAGMKSSKRGTYYKKRRRWEKAKRVVDETRGGGFDGVVVSSVMEPRTILKELIPLVRGGGRVVVYSPNVEPLVELCDLYSKERRTAYVNRQADIKAENEDCTNNEGKDEGLEEEDADFPLNPTLLLAPSLQTARARHWQVLPSRTHPMMTSRGGAEGYLFTATRVLPIEGKVEARGHWRGGKKRKTGTDTAVST